MKNSTALILILVSIGLFYTFISPEYSKVKALRTSAAEYEGVVANVEKLKETRDVLMDKYKTIPQSEVDKLSKILPDNIDTVRLAVDLDAIGSKYGVVLKEVQVKNGADASTGLVEATGKPYQSAKVTIITLSTYDAFRKFIKDVEASDRISNIKEVVFQSQENGLYEYRITLETYWVK